MPAKQPHKSQPDMIKFLFCRSFPVVRGGGQEKYPIWTLMLDKISLYDAKDKKVQKVWADMGGRIHVFWDVSLDVWFPTCRRKVTSSLSGVSSSTTYPKRGHNIPEDLNFHQHLCENLKRRSLNPLLISRRSLRPQLHGLAVHEEC